jgi:hypothetical protein
MLTIDKIFGRERIFGKPVSEIIKPKQIAFDQEKVVKDRKLPQPYFEILYLDDELRIQRTSQGYLFIVRREDTNKKLQAKSEPLELGPIMTKVLGVNGMKAVGILSVVPYLLFFYKFFEQYANSN